MPATAPPRAVRGRCAPTRGRRAAGRRCGDSCGSWSWLAPLRVQLEPAPIRLEDPLDPEKGVFLDNGELPRFERETAAITLEIGFILAQLPPWRRLMCMWGCLPWHGWLLLTAGIR